MHKKFFVIGLLIIGVIGLLLFFFWPHKTIIKNAPAPSNAKIVAFGDSLIQGVGSTEGHDLVSLLSQKTNLPMVNLGVSGDTTLDALLRLPQALAEQPDIAIVLLGGNDYLKKIPKEKTFENLGKIIEAFQNQGAAVLVLGVRGGILRDNYAKDYETLARNHQAAYVADVLAGLFADSRYMSDTIHPNDVGYALMADRVYEELKNFYLTDHLLKDKILWYNYIKPWI